LTLPFILLPPKKNLFILFLLLTTTLGLNGIRTESPP